MPRHLIAVNLLLVAISAVAVVYMVRDITAMPTATTVRSRRAATPSAPSLAEPSHAPGSFTAVASRNLFSPTRTEAPPSPATGAAAAPPMPKPNLYGVVLREEMPIAYLEDPATKRVTGYRTGDTIAGGVVQLIAADHVVLTRPEGRVEVRLSDPSKPRAPVPVAGQPGGIAGAVPPGVMQPSPAPGMPRFPEGGGQPGGLVQPPTVGQPAPVFPGRRPLPQSLRRLIPGSTLDAPRQ